MSLKRLNVSFIIKIGTLEDDRTVLYKAESLDGTKPKTNPNPNLKLT